jgi:hypothetical protein
MGTASDPSQRHIRFMNNEMENGKLETVVSILNLSCNMKWENSP